MLHMQKTKQHPFCHIGASCLETGRARIPQNDISEEPIN